MSKTQLSNNRLAQFLRKKDGHLGRTGDTALALAKTLGVSIHLVQSMAMGRRPISEENQAKIVQFIKGNG